MTGESTTCPDCGLIPAAPQSSLCEFCEFAQSEEDLEEAESRYQTARTELIDEIKHNAPEFGSWEWTSYTHLSNIGLRDVLTDLQLGVVQDPESYEVAR